MLSLLRRRLRQRDGARAEVYRRVSWMPPFVPSMWIDGPPPFSRASRRRRLDSVVSSDSPPVSMPPLVTLAEIVAARVAGQPQLDAAVGALRA